MFAFIAFLSPSEDTASSSASLDMLSFLDDRFHEIGSILIKSVPCEIT
jgi:hypothetical protein